MTHVIGKPPAPKGGATFGDVPATKGRDSLCLRRDGCLIARIEEHAAVNAPGVHVNAKHIPSGAEFWLDYDEPVTPLDITPRDPEPDPAVTTYGELHINEWFECVGPGMPPGIRQRFHGGHTFGTSVRVDCSPEEPVRRVAASVVVHEEPGTHVLPESDGMFSLAEAGYVRVSRSHLRCIVQQGAAALAQEPASPESGEPDPTEDRSKPAPGYEVVWMESADEGFWRMSKTGRRPGIRRMYDEAIAWTWTQHDAQQAGKGGE